MRRLLVALLLLLTLPGHTAESKTAGIAWESWSDSVFERAARENRFVLLDLEAVWCHWCHVMDEVTYSDPKVVELIKSRYIAVRVDQDRGRTSRVATRATAGRRRSCSTPRAARS